MYDGRPIEALMEKMWENGKGTVPTFALVRAAMTEEKGSSKNVATTVKNWKAAHGLTGQKAKGKNVGKTRTRKAGTTTAAGGTGNVSRSDILRLTEQAKAATDRLAAVEERLRLLENGGIEERLRSLEGIGTEERLRSLETDDERLLHRVSAAHRRRVDHLWDRVLIAISGIFQTGENLTWHDVFEMLPAELGQEAKILRQLVSLDALAVRLGMSMDLDHPDDLEE